MKNNRYSLFRNESEEKSSKDGYDLRDVMANEEGYKILREVSRSETFLSHIAKELDMNSGTARNMIRPLKENGFIKVKRVEGKTKILELNQKEIYFGWKNNLLGLCKNLKEEIEISSEVENEIEEKINRRENLDTPIPRPEDDREYESLEAKYYSLHIYQKLLEKSPNEEFQTFFYTYISNYLESVEESTIDQMLFADIKDMSLEATTSKKHHTTMVRQCLAELLIYHAISEFPPKKNAYREALDKVKEE